jgi:hypothetical protein
MKHNPAKTMTLTISWSRTPWPQHSDLLLGGSVIDVSQSLVVLGVTLHSKLSFKAHIREVVSSSSRALEIMTKASTIFQNTSVLEICFRSYVISRLEYCVPIWGSPASCQLRLLDEVVHMAAVRCRATTLCELSHRRNVSFLCMLYKIYANDSHPLNKFLVRFVPRSVTRLAVVNHPCRL